MSLCVVRSLSCAEGWASSHCLLSHTQTGGLYYEARLLAFQVLSLDREVMLRWVLLALLFGVCASGGEQKNKKVKPQSLSRGWGDDISWVKTYEEGLSEMVTSNKPLMVIHHLDECPFSQALKKAFVAKKPIQKMAKEDFIMVNLVEETEDPNMAPDGHYVPRILFIDPSMTVRRDIAGKYNNRLYTYQPEDMDLCE
ncbi:Anterior gradient protein 3 -like isoform 6 [Scophthalmus maximus]|uniref:Anterior gradient protein 3-like isoform 6 n=1 Tax=Scophthalmus maximus TaxID=52904 RepID=A0A2U9C895_SCOMX|nr:anterior gradient 1 isoform X2 [Scophthalmus maximus]AWP12831.1 Anterior gradient protein 3 -like isoform 6 [Scophthalmus maximus]